MPRKKTTPDSGVTPTPTTDQVEILPIPAVSKTAIIKARDLALAIVAETRLLADNLVVETEDQYHDASEILHKIKVVGKRLDIPFDEVIKPVRSGLDKVYAVRRSIENPLLDLEVTVKEKMRVFKVGESARLDAERRERGILQNEAERVERLRLASLPQPIATSVHHFEPAGRPGSVCAHCALSEEDPIHVPRPEVVALPLVPPTQPVRAASSSATKVKRVKVVDMSLFIHAVSLGIAPEGLLTVNWTALNQMLKDNPDSVATIPGLETFDDFTISGR